MLLGQHRRITHVWCESIMTWCAGVSFLKPLRWDCQNSLKLELPVKFVWVRNLHFLIKKMGCFIRWALLYFVWFTWLLWKHSSAGMLLAGQNCRLQVSTSSWRACLQKASAFLLYYYTEYTHTVQQRTEPPWITLEFHELVYGFLYLNWSGCLQRTFA